MRLPSVRAGRSAIGGTSCANCLGDHGLGRARWSNGRRYWLCQMCRTFLALKITPEVEGHAPLVAAPRRRCPTMDEQEQRLRGGGLRSTRLEWAEAAREQRAHDVGAARGWTRKERS